MKKIGAVITVFAALGLTACGGHKILKEPQPLTLVEPLAVEQDDNFQASLDWVIFRDGPGTWSRDADWDEYLISLRNDGADTVWIDSIAVYDSLDVRAESNSDRKELIKASKDVAGRYKEQGLKVRAGSGTVVMAAAATATTATVVGVAAAGPLLASSAAVGVVAVSALATPVLITGGIMKAVNQSNVAEEIVRRQTALPIEVAPGGRESITVFFPLTPSPTQIEIVYRDAMGQKTMLVDTRSVLSGLHLDNAD